MARRRNGSAVRRGLIRLLGVCIWGLLGAACGHVEIDYVNFFQFNGIRYISGLTPEFGRTLTASDLGPVYAKVHAKLSGNVSDPNYRSQDGDAAYLDPGTPVYEVKGYAATFRLAAYLDGRLDLYEVDTNPRARVGADLLDIGGKVRAIDVISAQDGTTVLATISDQAEVRRLVAMVLVAPVNQAIPTSSGQEYIVAFRLADGTATARIFWPKQGALGRGILVPPAFGEAIQAAVTSAS